MHITMLARPTRETARIKAMTNEEFVANLMQFSDHGALMQFLIIDLLTKGAERVASAPMVDDGGMINMHAWQRCAAELRDRLAVKYGGL